MTVESSAPGHIVDLAGLPDQFPTHRHTPSFWEGLGRVVATFGFLEEALGKAIFALTATRAYSEEEIEGAFEAWLPTLKKALSDPLGGLITAYDKAAKGHDTTPSEGFDDLIAHLRHAAVIRNVLCHGSWRLPDDDEKSLPLFANKQGLIFQDKVDLAYFAKTQRAVAELAAHVMNTITGMGWQFPGSGGPGAPIMRANHDGGVAGE